MRERLDIGMVEKGDSSFLAYYVEAYIITMNVATIITMILPNISCLISLVSVSE
jgi:hypothetical protein